MFKRLSISLRCIGTAYAVSKRKAASSGEPMHDSPRRLKIMEPFKSKW
jgi:hypothetical protein